MLPSSSRCIAPRVSVPLGARGDGGVLRGRAGRESGKWRTITVIELVRLAGVLSDPPSVMSSGMPSMYKTGFSLLCFQVRHTYRRKLSREILLVVHSLPNSQTTNRPSLPPTPSSAYWTSGWRYMKAVHGTTPWTCTCEAVSTHHSQ